ncbi:sensor histidine kinase [Azospirillum picis]|uniref:histidine kinase n=1 Tax=Azospirillum picis TaxID=488438 RepID=A0ABU0MJU5_9PROT|nr:7TM-DISM domain-containing protein [Azospirillum picis]MBP2300034.1 signal transduction histidine kinase [Azospirillum picis]MDQ0533728.1 signal transduction histidine kinase [Azospirillum picis]
MARLAVLIACLALAVLPFAGPALADAPPAESPVEPLRLEAATSRATLAGHFARLIDPERRLDLADVLQADAQGRMEPGGDFRGAGQTRDIHWYRFDLLRPPGAPADWILEMGEPYIDHLDLFIPRTAEVRNGVAAGATRPVARDYRLVRLGDFVPRSERPMNTRMHALPLSLPEGEPVSLYLRVDSVSAIRLSARLWSPVAYAGHQTTDLLFQGLFFGVLGVLSLGYFALGLLLRDEALLAYTSYVATVFTYYLFANGIAGVLLPDLPGWVMNMAVGGSGFLGFSAALLMWVYILDLRTHAPLLRRCYQGLALLALLALPTTVTPLYAISNPVVTVSALVVVVIALVLTARMTWLYPGDLSPRFYLASTLVSLAGLLLAQLALRGLLPADAFVADPYQTASLLAVLILGIGLALRIGRLQAERLRAREETAFATKRAEEQRTFVAMLSHEFRTPLASIDSAAQMIELSGAVQAPSALNRLQRVRDITRKMAELVDLFLSADALDQGALALNPEPVTLGRMLEEALDGLAGLVAESRLAVEVERPDRLLMVDTPFMAVAIGNLVQNALRYSPPESPVRVSAAVVDIDEAADARDPGGRDNDADEVVIRVSDRGLGMSLEEVERIGSIYFRASSSRGTKGSGLGLYMTQKIISAHGGVLTVESTPGAGSVFTIRLPAAPAETVGDRLAAQ